MLETEFNKCYKRLFDSISRIAAEPIDNLFLQRSSLDTGSDTESILAVGRITDEDLNNKQSHLVILNASD